MLSIEQFVIRYLTHILFLIIYSAANAQEPAHFFLGEDALSGLDIYDITQDKDHNYWFATSDGIVKYDGYFYQNIDCSEAIGSSMFSWKKDASNSLYCSNLHGQIFRITGDSCTLYFQIPESLMFSEFDYTFDNAGNMIVAAKKLFKVSDKKELKLLFPATEDRTHFSTLFTVNDSTIVVYEMYSKQLVTLANGEVSSTIKLKNAKSGQMLYPIQINNQLYYYDKLEADIYYIQDNTLLSTSSFIPDKQEGIYRFYVNNNDLFITRHVGGVQVFDENFEPLYNGENVFSNYLISSIYHDLEGNILLGTFKNGILVIPNKWLINYNGLPRNIQPTKITSTAFGKIFLGTQNGSIFSIDSLGEATVFYNKHEKAIEVLETLEPSNNVWIDSKYPFLLNFETKGIINTLLPYAKQIQSIGAGRYVVATNSGLSTLIINEIGQVESYKGVNMPSEGSGSKLIDFEERVSCVNYDSINNILYVGASSGLKIVKDGKVEEFLFEGKALLCKDILVAKNKVYIGTHEKGILVFERGVFKNQWTIQSGLCSNSINKLMMSNDVIYVATKSGIQLLNKAGNSLKVLNNTEGIKSDNILDFEIVNNRLWLLHEKGIQYIPINKVSYNKLKPKIRLELILQGDEEVLQNASNEFQSSQNKFEFVLKSGSIKYQKEIKYYHKLEGIDEDWQVNTYSNNRIMYKTLPPGEYTFYAKMVIRGKESEVVSYQFSIAKPYWNTWWFYLIILSVFIVTSSFVFNRISKNQRKRSNIQNELNISKMTAIQSQMNPHFIFNVLNSIQDLVLKGDVEFSYKYITEFANLIRRTLDYSDKEFIDFDDEIKLLKIYLYLEKLRFKEDFEYEINLNDINEIMVPPMLVQPFIENALIHGLMHKDGVKKLTIDFKLKDQLECTITDNGVGRKKSLEIKKRKNSDKSFSIGAIKRRFEILENHFGGTCGFNYVDLIEDGKAIGTKVVIRIPVKHMY